VQAVDDGEALVVGDEAPMADLDRAGELCH
jgi:hypothetical protein